eukprot:2560140-Rhodomonas_salina.1
MRRAVRRRWETRCPRLESHTHLAPSNPQARTLASTCSSTQRADGTDDKLAGPRNVTIQASCT